MSEAVRDTSKHTCITVHTEYYCTEHQYVYVFTAYVCASRTAIEVN